VISASLQDLRGGFAVRDRDFDLLQQGYDFFWLVSPDEPDQLSSRGILSFHLVQIWPVTS